MSTLVMIPSIFFHCEIGVTECALIYFVTNMLSIDVLDHVMSPSAFVTSTDDTEKDATLCSLIQRFHRGWL